MTGGPLSRSRQKESHLGARLQIFTVAFLLVAATLVSGCRTTVAGQSVWVRPAFALRARSVDVGDTRQVHIPEYTPRGDSFMVMVRVFPEDKKKKKLTGANIRDWPKTLKDRFGNSTD